MQASAPAFVPSFLKVSQAQELSPYAVGDLGDQSHARKSMPCSPASVMLTVSIWNMISLDAYSDWDDDDDDDDQHYSSKQVESTAVQEKDKVPTFDGSIGESGSHIAELDSEIPNKELDEQMLSSEDPRERVVQPIEQVGPSFSRETLLQLRCKIDDTESKPLWRMQSFVPMQVTSRNDVCPAETFFKDAPWRKDVAKLGLRPPPGLEDVLWQKSNDEHCPSTCDGSSASCSGESESETHDSDSETSDREADAHQMARPNDAWSFASSFNVAPWRQGAAKTTLNTRTGLKDFIEEKTEDKPEPSVDDKESKRPWRKARSQISMATGTSMSEDHSVVVVAKVRPWRKDSNEMILKLSAGLA